MLRNLGRFVFLCAVAPATLAASAARHIIPTAAPHGARFVVAGSGLDDPSISVAFADGNGGTVSAPIAIRTAAYVEGSVPIAAAGGTVTVGRCGSVIGAFSFTLLPDPPLIKTATIIASHQAHDIFNDPSGVAIVTPTGAIYVSDTLHHQVKSFAPDGTPLSVIGTGSPGITDGAAAQAQFKQPLGLAFDAARNLIYVADSGNNAIRRIAPDGSVTTLAGSGRPEDIDGAGTQAGFKSPEGVAVDAGGNVYVADAGNNAVRLISPAGVVSSVAGGVHDGFADGPVAQALFKQPSAIAVDSQGALYVADTGNNRIRRIAAGIVATVAGTGHPALVDGSTAVAEFNAPAGITIDEGGSLLVDDTGNDAIRRISFSAGSATVSTIAGSGKPGYADGNPAASLFNQPIGADMHGALAVADSMNDALRFIYAAIQISGVYPGRGPVAAGNTVRIFGTGFVPGATQVAFGANAPIAITFVTSTEILVTVPPAAAGSVDISVTTLAGSSTLAGAYTYLPPPVISTITPHKGKTAGGDSVTISGSSFADDGDTTVIIGGSAASVTINDPTSLMLVTPPGSSGPADVVVTTPGGTTTQSGGFIYFAPPVMTSFVPSQGGAGTAVTITGQNFDADATGDQVLFGTLAATIMSATPTQLVATVPNGAITGKITVTTAGGSVASTTDFAVATFTALNITSPTTAFDVGTSVQFNAVGMLLTGAGVDVTSKAAWTSNNLSFSVTSGGLVTAIGPGVADITASLGGFIAARHVTASSVIVPPDPSTIAPRLDPTVVGMFADEISFLYSGPNAIQTGVAPGAIDDNRATVIRGRLLAANGQPLPAVHVTALNHPELGQTLTRADGMFDFVINGGGTLALQFQKPGYISAQRSVTTVWGQQAAINDVVLIGYDPQVTAINLGTATDQIAAGTTITDAGGTRRALLIIPAGTTAVLAFPNGTTQPAPALHIRATEYTVGAAGPKAMPALLPPNSAYTYCVELSADEAVAAGADVHFSKAIAVYTNNFLGFPVGMTVPAGFYDRQHGTWIPSDNGIVLKILSIAGGSANIDLNGSGMAATPAALAAIGIDDAERQVLATQTAPGQTLWRVPVAHFSPLDPNGNELPPNGAGSPKQPQPVTTPAPSARDSCGWTPANSIVNCYSATLYESTPIVGTPFSLEYDSSRLAPTQNSMTISLSGATLPSALKRIDLEVDVAGKSLNLAFPPQPNLSYNFTWDGLDVYGRRVQGATDAGVALSYVYDSTYASPPPGGRSWNQIGFVSSGVPTRTEFALTQFFTVRLGHFDVRSAGLGGWSLSAQQLYDGRGGAIYDAGGTERSGDLAQTKQLALSTYAGNGQFGFSGDGGPATSAAIDDSNFLAVGPDGSLYTSEFTRIRRVDPQTGIINTVAGNGQAGSTPDGVLALGNPIQAFQLAVGPDGTLYFADGFRVRKIVNGLLTTVAGNGTFSFSLPPDGASATQVSIVPEALAVGPDGTVYIALPAGMVRVTPDGLVSNYASLGSILGLAVGPAGELYAVDNYNVFRIDSTGTTIVAGPPCIFCAPPLVDGQPATSGSLSNAASLAVAPDGTVLVSETGFTPRIRAIGTDGIATTLIGNGQFPRYGQPVVQDLLARAAPIGPWGVAVAPDGSVFIVDQQLGIIRRAENVFPPAQRGQMAVPSPDGATAYVIENGRHTSTVDTLTGVTLQTLAYDANGFLTSITDLDGNVTTIQRAPDGSPTAIIAPGGQTTALQTSGGFLSQVTDPAGQSVQLAYDTNGLLTDLTDPRKGLHRVTYDASGLVTRDEGPDGSFMTLTKNGSGQNYTMTRTTAEGHSHVYQVQLASDTSAGREHDNPDGTFVKYNFAAATTTASSSDGSSQTTVDSPDPRFGMMSPFLGSGSFSGGGKTAALSFTRSAVSDPTTPFALSSLNETLTLNGKTWTNSYTGSNKTTVTTTPAGRTVTSTLDAKGRLASLSQPNIAALNFSYGSFGQLASIQDGMRTTTFGYDARHQLTSITDALQRTVQFAYDDAGRVTTQTLPDSRVIAFGYDAAGNVTSVTPPSRPNHLFTFTPGDLMAGYTPPAVPNGGATTYSYNLDRQLTAINRPDGSSIGVGYDAFGRPSTVSIARGKYAYGYDGTTGQLTSVSAPDGGSLAYAYSGPLLSSVTWSGTVAGPVSFAYDNNFRLTSETAAGSNVSFGYDPDGLLIAAGAMTLTRDPQNGLLSGSTLGSVTDAWTYNAFAEPLSYTATAAGNTVLTEQYTRNDAGQIVQKNESILGVTHSYGYSYDTAGRLTGVTADGTPNSSYSYDANSNRLPGTYDDQDQMLSYGGATYTYTAAGELATKTAFGSTSSYSYDELGNLTHVALPNGEVIDYVIDGQNRRVGKKIDGSLVRQWLYGDALRIVAELDGTGSLISRFVYGSRANVPGYMIRGGVTYRIVSDHLGSPRLIVNTADGTIAQRLDYDAFGVVIADTNPAFQPFGFAGGLYDPDTGFVRFGTRDYDASTGRWAAKDEINFSGGSSNLYTYSMNDPVDLTDSAGMADLTFSAGFHLPIFPGVAVGPTFSSTSIGYFTTQQPTPGLSGLQPIPPTIEFELGAIADLGGNVGVSDLSNTGGHCAAPFSINLGLGKFFGIQINPRTTIDRSRSIFNPVRYVDGISVGFGPPGFVLPVSVSGLTTK